VRFDSFEFIVFLALTLVLAAVSTGRRRHAMLLVASYFFYASWSPPFIILLWFSTLLDFFCGGQIAKSRSQAPRLGYLLLSLIGNLGVLVYFKYGNFFLDNVAFVSGLDPSPFYLDVIIPLGISFYTFQSMSYTIDLYRREAEPCRSLLDFALYVTFFPQLIAGPVLRVSEFIPQLRRTEPVREAEVLQAVELFLLGLFKKTVIADNIGILVDQVFAAPASYNAGAIYLAAVGFFIQIYCDFSGYSTMARGLALLFGFKLPNNFDYPLLRWNPALFRRSWHITMGNWFQNYVYRPLSRSGNSNQSNAGTAKKPWVRESDGRLVFNVVFTWGLLGLWHGASWNFVLWGLSNGIQLALYLFVLRRKSWSLPDFHGKKFLGWLINFNLWVPGSILFRAQNLPDAWVMLTRLATIADGRSVAPGWYVGIAVLGGIHLLSYHYYKEDLMLRLGWAQRSLLVSGVVAAIAAFAATGRPFIYFQF